MKMCSKYQKTQKRLDHCSAYVLGLLLVVAEAVGAAAVVVVAVVLVVIFK
jgi:hypothetical protein